MKKILMLICICLLVCGCSQNNVEGEKLVLELADSKSNTWEYEIKDDSIVSVKKGNDEYTIKGLKEGETKIIFKALYWEDKSVSAYKVYNVKVDKSLNIEYEYYESVDDITLGKENWIVQKNRYYINDNDYFEITDRVVWEVPEECDGNTTCSFDINVPYIFYVDGQEYEGNYTLGDFARADDINPKFDLDIVNLTVEGFTKVKITEK